jgi:hypothetical protein
MEEKLLFVLIRMHVQCVRAWTAIESRLSPLFLFVLSNLSTSLLKQKNKISFYKRGLLMLFPPSHLLSLITMNYIEWDI